MIGMQKTINEVEYNMYWNRKTNVKYTPNSF